MCDTLSKKHEHFTVVVLKGLPSARVVLACGFAAVEAKALD